MIPTRVSSPTISRGFPFSFGLLLWLPTPIELRDRSAGRRRTPQEPCKKTRYNQYVVGVEDKIRFDFETGRPSTVATTLRRRVSAYTREGVVRGFKIGITNSPHVRFSKGYAKNYAEMIVLYKSSSLESVSQVERDLIAHNKEITKNRIAGGGGNYGTPPFYLYVVLRYM